MLVIEIGLGILIGLIIFGVIGYIVFRKPFKNYIDNFQKNTLENSLQVSKQAFRDLVHEERKVSVEQIDARVKLGERELKSQKDQITNALNNLQQSFQKELKENKETLLKSDQSLNVLKAVIKEHQKVTEGLSVKAENLSKVLASNQLRGAWGQMVAEDLLKSSGFVKGKNFVTQTQQGASGSIPDITVLLPDNAKLNIDAKFPLQALRRFQQTEDEEQKKKYLNEFKADVKTKIKQVAGKDYISPSEKTLDFAIMFVPSEVVFGFIHEKYLDLIEYAFENKVIMCGPFGFTAILRMVQQAYDNFRYQKNLYQIIGHIKIFEQQFQKYGQAVDVLGDRIKSVQKQYNEVVNARTNQLLRSVNKIKAEELSSTKQNQAEELIGNDE